MNLNTLTLVADKDGASADEVRASLREAYPGYRIANLFEKDDEWEAILEKPLDKVSSRTRLAEFPPTEEDSGSDEPSEKPKKKPKPKDESEGGEDDFGGEDEGDGEEDPFGGEEKEEVSLKSIQDILKDLTEQVTKLEEKAGIVDDVHGLVKPHVEGPDMGGGLPGPGDIGPTAPGGANPLGAGGPGGPPGGPGGPGGGMPGAGGPPGMGGKPPVPRGPRPAQGFDRRKGPQRGIPQGIAKTQHKVAFASMSNETKEFSVVEAIAAIEEHYPGYKVEDIRSDAPNNRYVAKLTVK